MFPSLVGVVATERGSTRAIGAGRMTTAFFSLRCGCLVGNANAVH
jgi:hypothetical protein